MPVIWIYSHIDSFIQLHLLCVGTCASVIPFVFLHAGLTAVLDFLTPTGEIQHSKMVTALASAFIIFGKNETLIFGFCLNQKVGILSAENFLDFCIKILQSFSDTLNFVSGNTTRF